MQPAGSPIAAAHWSSCLTPTAEAIGARASTETIVITTVNTSSATIHFFSVAIRSAPTPRCPSTPSRAVATCSAWPATDRIRK